MMLHEIHVFYTSRSYWKIKHDMMKVKED